MRQDKVFNYLSKRNKSVYRTTAAVPLTKLARAETTTRVEMKAVRIYFAWIHLMVRVHMNRPNVKIP